MPRTRGYALYLLAALDGATWWRTLAAIALITTIVAASCAAIVAAAQAAGHYAALTVGCALLLRTLLRGTTARIGGTS